MFFNNMAPEVVYNILSFLTFPQVYQLRSVCKKFQAMAEYHIYQEIRTKGENIKVKLDGGCSKSIELMSNSYDERNKVIEFIPKQRNCTLSLANTSRQQWSAYHRLLKIHFSGWLNQQDMKKREDFQHLSPQDQAMLLYHYQYNSAIEKTYELPSWNKASEIKSDNNQHRYLGDKGLILSMSYEQSNYKPLENQVQVETAPLASLPLSYYSYHSVSSSAPMPSAPRMEVHWIRVTLDWVLSGMIKSTAKKQKQIYDSSFNKLNDLLRKEGCYKYDPFSEPILDFIIKNQQVTDMKLTADLVNYVQLHTHECHTRLSRLQRMLEGAGLDSQIVWKYSFAKAFVVGNGLLCEEDIVRRIQDSEEEWRKKKKMILRKLDKTYHNNNSNLYSHQLNNSIFI